MSKYDADEWEIVTDYGWRLDMHRVVEDIDARLTALEATQPAPIGETGETSEQTGELSVQVSRPFKSLPQFAECSYYQPATPAQIIAAAKAIASREAADEAK